MQKKKKSGRPDGACGSKFVKLCVPELFEFATSRYLECFYPPPFDLKNHIWPLKPSSKRSFTKTFKVYLTKWDFPLLWKRQHLYLLWFYEWLLTFVQLLVCQAFLLSCDGRHPLLHISYWPWFPAHSRRWIIMIELKNNYSTSSIPRCRPQWFHNSF